MLETVESARTMEFVYQPAEPAVRLHLLVVDADPAMRSACSEIAASLGQADAVGQGLVVSCSALKRSYRDLLRATCPGLRLIHLHGTPDLLRARLQARSGHYMPASLLASQLDALEPPAADEAALVYNIHLPADQISAAALAQLRDTIP